jgi:hypothetical protein
MKSFLLFLAIFGCAGSAWGQEHDTDVTDLLKQTQVVSNSQTRSFSRPTAYGGKPFLVFYSNEIRAMSAAFGELGKEAGYQGIKDIFQEAITTLKMSRMNALCHRLGKGPATGVEEERSQETKLETISEDGHDVPVEDSGGEKTIVKFLQCKIR